MIKAKVSTDYKDIERIFAGGTIQKEIIKVWSTEADAYVFEAWKILEMEGPLPLTVNSNGEALIDYRIYGNTEQTGTPTPENPIMPIGCGERTENLFDINKLHSSITVEGENFTKPATGFNFDIFSGLSGSSQPIDKTKSMFLKAGEYVATVGKHASDIRIARVNDNEELANITNITIIQSSASFTLNYDSYVTVRISKAESLTISNLEISAGSTIPTHYEPYGYELPILSNSTVTNIYIGEVETTRRIKKLVLTGEEGWSDTYWSGEFVFYSIISATLPKPVSNIGICSHFKQRNGSTMSYGEFNILFTPSNNRIVMPFAQSGFETVNDFKSYLAAQYAAGTPVTVWYVLAEPETAVVNEPLMKIGDYADTIDSTQAAVQIPTFVGTTVIDYVGEDHFITSDGYELVDKNQNGFLLSGSALHPEKMYIKYKGR